MEYANILNGHPYDRKPFARLRCAWEENMLVIVVALRYKLPVVSTSTTTWVSGF
jgi:hypothetical protein